MDSNASYAREVERKVGRDNDSLVRGRLLKTPPLVIGQPAEPTQRKREAGAPCRYGHGGNRAPRWPRRRSSHCVLSCFAEGSSARCNRGRTVQVPEQLTLTQRVQVSSPAGPTIQIALTVVAVVVGFGLPGALAERARPTW